MQLANRHRFAALDIETTGLAPERHRIIEIAVVDSGVDPPTVVFDSLIRPDCRIGNRHIHGINNRAIRKAPSLAQIVGALAPCLFGRILVAHNARFEAGFLGRELALLGARWPRPMVCTMELHRALHGTKATLESATREAAIAPDGPMHRARTDALLTARLFSAQRRLLAEQGVLTLADTARFAPRAVLHLGADPLTAAETASFQPPWPAYPRERIGCDSQPHLAPGHEEGGGRPTR